MTQSLRRLTLVVVLASTTLTGLAQQAAPLQ
jgi:hypothetical protein